MEYQGIQYYVIQGIERRVRRWSVSMEGMLVTGQAETKPEAVVAAQKAIDKARRQKPGCSA